MANSKFNLNSSLLGMVAQLTVKHVSHGTEGSFLGDENDFDIVSYAGYTDQSLIASLTPSTVANGIPEQTNWAAGVTYEFIDGLEGTAFSDRLIGDANVNRLIGGAGDDKLSGMAGADELQGGIGTDYASYEYGEAVTVNLGSANYDVANTGDAAGDTFTSIEGILGSNFGDFLVGDGNDNTIMGGNGDDTIAGGLGADALNGGDGNDTLTFANAAAAISVDLSHFGAGTGESLGDTFTSFELVIGSVFDDTIGGTTSTTTGDTLMGGNGNDTLQGHAGADRLIGGDGIDTASYDMSLNGVSVSLQPQAVNTNGDAQGDVLEGIENLIGSQRNDELTGNDVANVIDGYQGADTMTGGLGSDIYHVDAANDGTVDTVIETDASANGGIDLVMAKISYALGANVEKLTAVVGENAIKLTGNALNNVITGNEKNNTIDGGAGADTMMGGAGNDTYHIDNVGDVIVDTSGTNIVYTSVNYTGAQFIGQVVATGSAALALTGDSLNNVLTGNAGANKINGGLGNDVLSGNAGNDWLAGGAGKDALKGGTGKDTFVFNTALNKKTNLDTIMDFNVKDDTIWLDNKYMPKLGKGTPLKPGKLNKAFFTIGDKAKDKNDYLIYDKKTGVLSYDKDGSGSAKAVEITKLGKNLKMTHYDFMII